MSGRASPVHGAARTTASATGDRVTQRVQPDHGVQLTPAGIGSAGRRRTPVTRMPRRRPKRGHARANRPESHDDQP